MLSYYKLYWINSFQINNRTARKGFWIPLLITIFIYIVFDQILSLLSISNSLSEIAKSVFILFNIIPGFTITVRRFHDVGLTMFIPIIFFLPEFISLIFTFIPNYIARNIFGSLSSNMNITSNFMLLFITFILFSLLIFVIVVCCMKSDPDINKYNKK